jgi:DNA-binding response OmpR family regulator
VASGEDKKLILVVDDEARMRQFIRMNLDLEGYRVSEAENGLAALDKVRDELPDLVLLDVMMPKLDGFETLRLIREVEDKVRGLELGADDYVTKPFSPRELSSRIKAVLRRVEFPGVGDQAIVKVDDYLSIDLNRREVIVNGEQIKLRPTEYRLLYHLVHNAGWTMTHEMLLSKVWGYEYREELQLLRVYINYLRQKIEPDPANPRYIFTERGLGYRFVDFKKPVEQ